MFNSTQINLPFHAGTTIKWADQTGDYDNDYNGDNDFLFVIEMASYNHVGNGRGKKPTTTKLPSKYFFSTGRMDFPVGTVITDSGDVYGPDGLRKEPISKWKNSDGTTGSWEYRVIGFYELPKP